MALSILFIVSALFAIRGFMLGFVGVIGKVLGLIAGYVVAYNVKTQAAQWVSQQASLNLPFGIIEIVCGIVLFITTLIIVGFAVVIAARLLQSLIPALESLLDDSTTGRVTGALSNALLGAAIVLVGIWGYGLLGKGPVKPPQLQFAADLLGNSLFDTIKEENAISIHSTQNSSGSTHILSTTNKTYSVPKGNGIIISDSNPEKKVVFNSAREEIEKIKNALQNSDLLSLLDETAIKNILDNPQIVQAAQEQVSNNPEQLSELSKKVGISQEQLETLLEKLSIMQ